MGGPAAPALTAMVIGAALSLSGCFEDECVDCPPTKPAYHDLSSPENLVKNLALAYQYQEIDTYAKLLAPDFVFKFQPVDALDLGFDTWNRDQDLAGTGALFATPLVGGITIALIHGPSTVAPGTFNTVEGEVRFIRINPTFLEVDIVGGDMAGTALRVDGDIQDMFFRHGNAAADEDTTRWFLFEWRDIPDPSGTGRAPGIRTTGTVAPAAIEDGTWGRIKTFFTDGQ
jgi:hypothetical protein